MTVVCKRNIVLRFIPLLIFAVLLVSCGGESKSNTTQPISVSPIRSTDTPTAGGTHLPPATASALDKMVLETLESINQYGWDPTRGGIHINWYSNPDDP
jgi:hypothetical protein